MRDTCRCGVALKPWHVPGLDRTFFPRLCEACEVVQAKEDQVLEAKKKEYKIQQKINIIVPELFRDADVEHLSKGLRANLISAINTGQGVFLWGKPGTGKSYAFCAIIKRLIRSGAQVKRAVWERITMEIISTYDQHGYSSKNIIEPLTACEFLFLEDLGTSTSINTQESDFSLRVLQMILDIRVEACKPVWVTSNKSIAQIGESFDERVASRLRGHCREFLVLGEDRRKS